MKKNIVITELSIAFIMVVVASLVLSSCGFRPTLVSFTSTPLPPTSTPQPPPETVTATVTNTPDPCALQNLQVLVLDFNRISREFDDLSVIAQNTPREQLAPIITQLQTIRRKSEDYSVPACMTSLKEDQLAYMNVFTDTLLALYSSLTKSKLTEKDVTLINQGMAQAVENHNQYMLEMARLLGVTPSVPTRLPASETPTTLTTTATP